MADEIGRELRVSELKPRTIVFLQKLGRNVIATMWVIDVGDVYVHFHKGVPPVMEFLAMRCGENLEEVCDDTRARIQIFEYLGEP